MECSSCLCNVSSLLFARVHVSAFYPLGSWAITTPSLSHLISTSKRTLTFHPLLMGLFSLLHVVTSVWLLSIWYMRSSPGVLGDLAMLCYAILASHHHSFRHAPVFRCAPLLLNFYTAAHFLKDIHFRQLLGSFLCL